MSDSRRKASAVMIEALDSRRYLASATVNFGDVRQNIDGFGASTAWMWNTITQTGLTNAFSTTSGAGLSLIRSRIAPNGTTSETSAMLQSLTQGARVWSTPWTPPREWKTNHDTANGGSLDPAHYQDYATQLANYIQDEAALGVPLYAVSLQNEPNWVASYESCIWTAQQFADFLPYVAQTFSARGITTRILFPESLNWNFSLADSVMSNPTLASYVSILAAHNYGESVNSYQPYANAGGKPVWETEVTLNTTSTAIANALDLADDIHQAMSDANASAYHYWWLNATGDSALLDGNFNATKRLWAIGQYSRFVRPGWVRVGETDDGGLDITTFKDPSSGKFAIVAVNSSTTASITESFTLSGMTAASVTPYITSASENMAQYPTIALTGGSVFSATIAASSIVTYYGISSSASTVQAPTGLTANPMQGASTTQIGLTWQDQSSAETGYTLERSLDGSAWTVVTSALAANTTTYTDTGRSENTRYYYRVKANSASGGSGYSGVVTTATVLSTPSNVGGTRTGSGVNVTWTINSGVSTGVRVDRSLDGVSWATAATLSARATSYSDTIAGYNANQVYYYRVRNTTSTNDSGWSRWNTTIAAPTTFAASNVTSSGITFNWNSPTVGLSGAWIEQYNAATGGWNTVSSSDVLATDGTWRLTGLASSTSYTFRMRLSGAADTANSAYTGNLVVSTLAPSVNPIVRYRADETSGAALADSSGNGRDATLTGSYSFAAGINANALTLSGGYGQLPSGVASELGDFTISTWIKPTSLDTWSRVFDFGSGTGNFMYFTPRSSAGFPRFSINSEQVNSSIALTAGTWAHVAITLSGSTATLYINGSAVGLNSAMTLSPGSLGVTTQNYLGKSQFSWDPAFKGSLDEFRIYERALTAAEVQSLAATTTPTIATAASATPNPVTGTTATLAVLGADDGGEANLTYTWSVTSLPAGAADPALADNSSHSARNTVVTFFKAGSYTLTAQITDAGGLSETSSVNITVNQTQCGISISPGSATVNPSATQQFTATAFDQFGNAMSAQPTVTWSKTSGTGTLGSTGLFTAPAAQGGLVGIQATAGGFSANAVATVPIDTTDTGPGIALTTTTGAWTASTTVGGYFGANYHYYNVTGGSGTATYSAAIPFSGQYAIYAWWTASTNRNAAVPFDITSASGVSTVIANQQNNGSKWNLLGTYDFIAGATGSVAIRTPANVNANASVIADGVLFQLVRTAPQVALAAAAAPAVVSGVSTVLNVLGMGDAGESNLTYTWTSFGPAPVAFSSNGSNSAKITTAMFIHAGTYTLTATISDNGLTTTSSTTIVVNPVLTQLVVAPGSTSLQVGQTRQFSVTAIDQFGETMTTPAITWSSSAQGSISASGLFTASAAGTATITAASGAIADSAAAEISSGSPTIVTAATAGATTVSGTSTTLRVLGSDDGGESALVYTWNLVSGPSSVAFSSNESNAAKNTTASFHAAGTYQFAAILRDASGNSVRSMVTVTVTQTATRLVATPASLSMAAGTTRQFTATATDQFGAPILSPAITWSVVSGGGSVSSTGLFTAPTSAGKSTVRATLASLTASSVATIFSWSPYSLVARKTSLTTAQVTFRDSTTIESGFQLQQGVRSANGAIRWTTIYALGPSSGSGALVTYTLPTSFSPGTYVYRVRATTASVYSNWSNTATLTF